MTIAEIKMILEKNNFSKEDIKRVILDLDYYSKSVNTCSEKIYLNSITKIECVYCDYFKRNRVKVCYKNVDFRVSSNLDCELYIG